MTYQGVVVITKCITPLKQKLTTLSWYDKILEAAKVDFYKVEFTGVHCRDILHSFILHLIISKLLENEKRHLVGCCCCWTLIYVCVNFLKKIQ